MSEHHPFRFELHFGVRSEDIDALGHVNNVVYVQWVQDVATAHWKAAARTDHLANVLWVLARHEIDYKVSAMPGDDIIARTWVGEPDGIRYPRHVELIRASDDKLLARSLTLWCPVDAKTLKLLRPPPADLNEGFFHPPIRAT
jgi:acyl-CoA thioester hydrolase